MVNKLHGGRVKGDNMTYKFDFSNFDNETNFTVDFRFGYTIICWKHYVVYLRSQLFSTLDINAVTSQNK